MENRLTDESLHGDQTFGDWVDGEHEAFKGHCPEQGGSRWRNQASRVDFVTIDCTPYVGERPSFIPAARSLDWACSVRSQF